MTETERIVDASGTPIPRPKKIRDQAKGFYTHLRVLLPLLLAIVAALAALLSNLDKITAFFWNRPDEGVRASLEIADIKTHRSSAVILPNIFRRPTFTIDFRLLNRLQTDESISSVVLTVDSFCILPRSVQTHHETYSYIYDVSADVDLINFTSMGDTVEVDVSQVVEATKTDRFAITVGVSPKPVETGDLVTNPPYTATWKITPTLVTSTGRITGKQIELVFDDESWNGRLETLHPPTRSK